VRAAQLPFEGKSRSTTRVSLVVGMGVLGWGMAGDQAYRQHIRRRDSAPWSCHGTVPPLRLTTRRSPFGMLRNRPGHRRLQIVRYWPFASPGGSVGCPVNLKAVGKPTPTGAGERHESKGGSGWDTETSC
jgi:hypothetical protein